MALKIYHITLAILFIALGTLLILNNSQNKITGLATKQVNQNTPDHIMELNISNDSEIRSLSVSGYVLDKGDINIYLVYDNISLLVANKTSFSGYINKSAIETSNISIKNTDLKLAFFLDNTTFNLTRIEYLFAENSSN